MRQLQAFKVVLDHNFTCVVVGALIGSALIPMIIDARNRSRAYAESQSSLAVQTLNNSNDLEILLNIQMTSLHSFFKHTQHADEERLLELKATLHRDIEDLYREFERFGWTWHWKVLDEVQTLKLVTAEEQEAIREDFKDYSRLLIRSTQLIAGCRGAVQSPEFEPGDPSVGQEIEEAKGQLRELKVERAQIARRVARMIAP